MRKILSKKFEEETILNLMESTGKGLLWFSAILISLSIMEVQRDCRSTGYSRRFRRTRSLVRAEKCFI